jgi:DNA polymerase II small subunit/DNA polymerase delta subunit B
MCCLRYEHEFYVQSRKRFPKEGKLVTTSVGEEKVVSIDIFHERIMLRGVDGDMRSLTLPEFKQETEQLAGVGVTVVAEPDEEESVSDAIRPEEISPELMYTAEHQIFVPHTNTAAEPAKTNGRESDGGSKRRRGRRGGRRGRGGEEPGSGGS